MINAGCFTTSVVRVVKAAPTFSIRLCFNGVKAGTLCKGKR